MGKVTGFVEWSRIAGKKRPVAERVADFREVEGPADPEELRRQAGRCMDCGVPFCQQGCPLGNPIPDFNDHVWHQRWRAAHDYLAATNNFPEFTGRLCPAPCEAACVLNIDSIDGKGAPITIEHVEKAIAERAFAEGWIAPRPPRARTGRSVGIVGAGPAGLAAADQLNRAGHRVVVYDARARAGGLLRYGIPDFKLEKPVIDRRLDVLVAEGVELRLGTTVGTDLGWRELRDRHDALLVAVGAEQPRELAIPGRELADVVVAMDYLVDQNQVLAGERAALRHGVHGKHVVILGGGDTGSDCLGTAHRQGAASVQQLELLPAPPIVRAGADHWPQWPTVLRTSSSQEEGGARGFGLRTTHFEGEDGRLTALHAVEVELEGGVLRDVPNSARRLACDAVILALGFTGVRDVGLGELGVERDARGRIATTDGYATTAPGVYVAGDARRGASLIVWAIAEGRQAAAAIDAALRVT